MYPRGEKEPLNSEDINVAISYIIQKRFKNCGHKNPGEKSPLLKMLCTI